ncbi:MAG: type I secretion system permease/ATPase [Pseudomonadota bacterium]
MGTAVDIVTQSDPGSACLAAVLTLQGFPTQPARLQRRFAPDGQLDAVGIVRAARELGARAKLANAGQDRWEVLPTPCIVEARDATFLVLARVQRGVALIQRPGRPPEQIPTPSLGLEASGRVIHIRPGESRAGAGNAFGLRWFGPALWRYRKLLAEVLGASAILQLFALASPLIFQVVIDKVLTHGALTTLDVLIIGLVTVTVFDALLGGVRSALLAHTTSRVDVELGAGLFRHLLSLPVGYFQHRPTGQTVARVRELENIRQFLTSSATTVTIDAVFSVLFLIVMYAYSPQLTLVVVASFPAYIALSVLVTPALRKSIDERFQAGAESHAFLVESVGNAETVKALAVEAQQRRRWETLLARYTRASYRAAVAALAGTQAVQFISKLCSVALLWFGARLVLQGDISVGQLIAFNMFANQLTGPVVRLAQLWQDVQQFRLSIARLGDVLNTPAEPNLPNARGLPGLRGELVFDNVVFRYRPEQSPILNGFNLRIGAGEVVGVVGRSGSGKSTLTRLLQRLYSPEGGRITVDGHDLRHLDCNSWRQQVGVVLQDSVMFSASVRDNIAIGTPQAPLDRVVAAARLADAHDFICALPEGYDTPLEERGANLSGGQRQRLAIARALLGDPKVLIFDEATSALDFESERTVQQNLQAISRGRTVIIVAHRLSTVRSAHRIVVVDGGTIIEQGAHQQLVARGGAYANLWQQQAA